MSPKQPAMAQARADFKAACGTPPSRDFRNLTGTATVTGVGFFDFLHAGDQAPNGIELHPVLRFKDAVCAKA
jgi:hypothetical protein